MRLPIVARQF